MMKKIDIDFCVIGGRITPKDQLLDLFPMKAMKGCHRDFHDIHMLTAPINTRTGHPLTPSRQLCAAWVVHVRDKVPES